MSGSINLYIGPTKAGKTTELKRQYNRLRIKYDKICSINGRKIAQNHFNSSTLENILEEILDYDIIIIDNIHLIKDCLQIIPILADKFNKTIFCAGLDNNESRTPYLNVVNLIPKCEYVHKMTAYCAIANDTTPAIFSKEVNGEYVPVARENGFLHVITGPMFSGKTTEILRQIEQLQSIGKSILTVNYSKDNRYCRNANITSHNNETIKTKIAVDDLEDIVQPSLLSIYDVIIVDEVQFIKNAYKTILQLVNDFGKTVIVSGLDGDFLQKPFGDVCSLIAQADKLTRLSAVCKLSKSLKDACFSKRLSKETATELIGADDCYMAVSREIYNLPDEQFANLIQMEHVLSK